MKRKANLNVTPFKKKRTKPQTKEEESDSESEQIISEDDHGSDVDDDEDQPEDSDSIQDDEIEAEDDEQDGKDEEDEEDDDEEEDEDEGSEEDDASGSDKDDDSENSTPSKNHTRGMVHKVKPLPKKKKTKPGVVYISSIPKHMNVTILRSLLEPYGEIGRIYLQPAQKDGKVRTKTANGKRAMMQYTEGWVEFVHKRVAKAIVPMLNMQPITNKKKSVFRDILWSMKYLSGFKWVHLNERLVYERAVAREKMREQIHQIRKEVTYHETKVHQKEVAEKNAERERKGKKIK